MQRRLARSVSETPARHARFDRIAFDRKRIESESIMDITTYSATYVSDVIESLNERDSDSERRAYVQSLARTIIADSDSQSVRDALSAALAASESHA